jgi:ketosteroid isomerase-like protein
MYCYHVDDNDPAAFSSLFAADCVWDGGPIGKFEGREAMAGFCAGLNQNWGVNTFRHHLANQVVAVDGDAAHLTAYVNVMKANPGDPIAIFASGKYNVDLVRQGGKWLIKKLVLASAFV